MFVLLLCIILVLVIVIFALQNSAVVLIHFLVWSTNLPLVLVIFCSVFAGALLMFCLALWRELKHKIKNRSKAQEKLKKSPEPDPIEIPVTAPMESSDESADKSNCSAEKETKA